VPTRRFVLQSTALAAGGLLGSLAGPARAQELEMAKIILGAPPGGSGDLMARRLAEKLRQAGYAKSVIVENRPGAGGQLAVVAVRDAVADGSVLLLVPSSQLSIYPYTYRKLPYKPDTDLAPLSLAAYANHALGIGPSVPAAVRTLAQFLDWTKANPELASYGSPASGSMSHLIVASIVQHAAAPLRHIPYKGSSPALQDLRGGQIAALTAPIGAFLPHLKSGQIRLLAVSGEKRSPFAGDIPTYNELGHGITAREWYGFFAPGKAAPAVVARTAAVLQKALAQPDVAGAMAEFGLEAATSTPQELAALLQADSREWREQIRKLGFTAES
jgi:tripartite-type tricarboxylate transporter receptor subunit TctC